MFEEGVGVVEEEAMECEDALKVLKSYEIFLVPGLVNEGDYFRSDESETVYSVVVLDSLVV